MLYDDFAEEIANPTNRRNIASSWNYKEGDSIRISCFTNCNQAELMLNGKSSGKKQLADAAEKVITWDIYIIRESLL